MELSKDQYNTLAERYSEFECIANPGCAHARNLDNAFLQKMKGIHQEVIGGVPININCKACIQSAMIQLWPLIESYAKKKRQFTAESGNN